MGLRRQPKSPFSCFIQAGCIPNLQQIYAFTNRIFSGHSVGLQQFTAPGIGPYSLTALFTVVANSSYDQAYTDVNIGAVPPPDPCLDRSSALGCPA